MKRRFYKIAKKYGAEIIEYKSKRSDMGVQMYDIAVRLSDGTEFYHSDGYYAGEISAQDTILEYFENEIKSNMNENRN